MTKQRSAASIHCEHPYIALVITHKNMWLFREPTMKGAEWSKVAPSASVERQESSALEV